MKRADRGFTLLELLIAIAIFSLLALASYRMLSSVLASDERTRRQEQSLRQLSRALNALERDVLQVIARPIRDGYGQWQPALLASNQHNAGLELSRGGWRNPLAQPRAELQRVRWQLHNGTLQRLYWPVLDQAQDSQAVRQTALHEVSALRLRLLDANGEWLNLWPEQPVQHLTAQQLGQLPRALEVLITTERFGEIRRVYRLPDAAPAEHTP